MPEKDITFINIYAPNTGALKYIKQILTDIKREINKNTVTEADFNTPLTSGIDNPDRKSIRQQWF